MNWDRIKRKLRQLTGTVSQQWSRLTADYAGVVAGKRGQRLGKIRAAHGVIRQADEKPLAEWLARQHKIDPIHK
jgi:uncharacterized protein YjbJ (UPF0337 family)